MFETLSQKLKANFTPEQQDYYLQLENELKELLGGQTQEEVLASGDPEIIQQILKIKQEMLNFVLTKKTREMVKQEEKEQEERILRQREKELEKERQAVSLDEIERKQKAGVRLTDNELKFLYRIDGFGLPSLSSYENKKRVEKIINQRNVKEDVSYVLGCFEDQVSLTQDQFLDGVDIEYHYGNLDFRNLNILSDWQLPKYIHGTLDLGGLTEGSNIINSQLPQGIGYTLNMERLWSAVDLVFPKYVGDFNIMNLTRIENVKFPYRVAGDFHVSCLLMKKGVELPKIILGSIYLYGTRLPSDFEIPKNFEGRLVFDALTSSEGLEIPFGVKSVIFYMMPIDEIEKLRKKFPHSNFEKN